MPALEVAATVGSVKQCALRNSFHQIGQARWLPRPEVRQAEPVVNDPQRQKATAQIRTALTNSIAIWKSGELREGGLGQTIPVGHFQLSV